MTRLAEMSPAAEPSPEIRMRQRVRYLSGLVRHAGVFVVVNAVVGIVDLTVGPSGLQWAYWITGLWGFVLAFHVLASPIDDHEVDRFGVTDDVGGGWDHREWPR